MTQILVSGEIEIESYYLPGPVDVKAIRKRAGMSQAKFAAAFALNPGTLQQWERHKAGPEAPFRAHLTVIGRDPQAVVNALRARSSPAVEPSGLKRAKRSFRRDYAEQHKTASRR